MTIYEFAQEKIVELKETTFGTEGLTERGDLQRLLRDQIDVVAKDVFVIAEEFGRWEDSQRRIDLLCLDSDANLIVAELKRGQTGGHMELQALRYAAMVSTMTFEQAVDAHGAYLKARGRDEDGAERAILDFLGWNEPNDDAFGEKVKILLVAGDFSRELTTAVLWLNDRDIDITCVRLKPYTMDGRVLMDVQQVIPLPEAKEYITGVREKARKEREVKVVRDHTKFDVTVAGETQERLSKRKAAYAVVRGLCDAGVLPEKITHAGEWNEDQVWRSVPAELDAVALAAALRAEEERGGPRFDANRWFCADDELIHASGRTWAFSNQWGASFRGRMDAILAAFPDKGVTLEASAGGISAPWNNRDFYVSFGPEANRSWEDARRYGFVSGGGARQYSRTLYRLKPGHRVFVNLPKTGFVGVGEVLDAAVPMRKFQVDVEGRRVPMTKAPLKASYHQDQLDDDEACEHLVRVRWLKEVPRDKAFWEPGLFANQHTACKLRDSSTIEAVSSHFGVEA